MTKITQDILSSSTCIVIGGFFTIGGIIYGFGTLDRPGPGLMPFIVGIISILFSSITLISAVLEVKAMKTHEKVIFIKKGALIKLLISLFALFAYAILLEPAGFLLTTIIFMIVILRFVGLQKWNTVIITSFSSALISYIIFVTLLNAQMPKGVLSFISMGG